MFIFEELQQANVMHWNGMAQILLSKTTVLCVNVFLWSKLNFQHHYSSLQCHMIRNHS